MPTSVLSRMQLQHLLLNTNISSSLSTYNFRGASPNLRLAWLFWAMTVLTLFAWLPPVTATETKQRTALVIGNASYREAPLRNPLNDARDMAQALKELGFDVMHRQDLDHEAMEMAILEFSKKLTAGAVGLFYFAGHGVQVGGRNYLLPLGADIQREAQVKYRAVDMGMIMEEMQYAGSAVNIIVLDACRNNPFGRSFRTLQRGLAVVDSPKGSLIAYATAPGSVAADGEGRNGIFTKHLLAAIEKPGLDIEQAFRRVRVGVLEESGGNQIPWVSTSLLSEFCFAGCEVELPSIGHLQVKVNVPDTMVYFDEKYAGTSSPNQPLETDLPSGPVEILVEAEGYQSERKQALVRARWWTPVSFDLVSGSPPKPTAIEELVEKAQGAIEAYALTSPPGENAVEYAEQILTLDPDNAKAQEILNSVVSRYVLLAEKRLRSGQLELAQIYQERARRVAEKHGLENSDLAELILRIDTLGRPKPVVTSAESTSSTEETNTGSFVAPEEEIKGTKEDRKKRKAMWVRPGF